MAGRNLFADEPVTDGRNLFSDAVPTKIEEAGLAETNFALKEIEQDQPFAEGAAQSLLQGATLGFSDEIQSAIAALVASPFISDQTIGQIYADARKSFREENEKFRKENPKTALGLEVAGGLATGGLAGGAKIGGAKTLGQAALQGAKTGTAIGAIAGAGFADEDDFFSQETLKEAAKTGALSGLLGGLSPAIIKGGLKAGKLIPKALPESMMETAVKIRPSVPQNQRASMIRTALDEGIMPTTKGLETISAKLTNLDRGLNKIIDDATEKGMLISKKALFSELRQLRKDLGGVNLRANKNLAQIDKVAKAFDQSLKRVNKPRLTPREVQDLKRSAYRQLRFDVSQQSASFASTEAEKGIIRGAKKSLEKISPGVKKLNLREGRLIELGEELERAVGRLDNRNFISLDTAAKVAAGAATGSPIGTVAGMSAAGLGAPRVKARAALILENIRKMDEMAETVKTLSPEAAAAFSVLVEDNKEMLNELMDQGRELISE